MDKKPEFQRVLIKLSGEALMGNQGFGITPEMIHYVAQEVAKVYTLGVEISIVVGGGNIFRGVAGSSAGMDRTSADNMGMLATVINSLALCDALEKCDVPTRVQTAIAMDKIAEPFIRRKAIRHLEKGRVLILGAGTGNPYFTTDTAAARRISRRLARDIASSGCCGPPRRAFTSTKATTFPSSATMSSASVITNGLISTSEASS